MKTLLFIKRSDARHYDERQIWECDSAPAEGEFLELDYEGKRRRVKVVLVNTTPGETSVYAFEEA